jgi:hypothetical protein
LQHMPVDSSDGFHDPSSHVRAPYATWFTVCGRNLITGLTPATWTRVDISSTCMVGQKLWVSLPLLTCSLSACPSRLLYRRGPKSRRGLRIILYVYHHQLFPYPALCGIFPSLFISQRHPCN